MTGVFQEFVLTCLAPRWFPAFPRTTVHNLSRSTSVHFALGYASRLGEQNQQSASDSKSKRARFLQSRKSHGLLLKMQKSVLAALHSGLLSQQ